MQNKDNINELISRAKSNDITEKDIMNSLSEGERNKVNAVLNNPKLMNELLSSQKAKELFKSLFGEK